MPAVKKRKKELSKVKGSRKGHRYTEDQKREILFWWVFCDENHYRTAQLVSKKFNRNITRKTIWKMAIANDFHVKAPFVKSAVEVYKRLNSEEEARTPEQIQLTGMGVNMLEIDWLMVRKAKDYMSGDRRSNSPFRSVKEVVDALTFVQMNVSKLIGQENIRRDAWDHTKEQEGGFIASSAEDILKELSRSEQNEILHDLEKRIISGEIR